MTTKPLVTRMRNPVEGTAGYIYMIDGIVAARRPEKMDHALLRRTRTGWALVGLSESEPHLRRLRQRRAAAGVLDMVYVQIEEQ